MRTGSKLLASLTLFCDVGKGAAPVLVTAPWGAGLAMAAAAGAVLGHLFPVWLRWRGGKGVATSLGAMLALAWPVALLGLATWLVVAGLSRYSSLAAVAAFAAAPFYAWWLADARLALFVAALSGLVVARHGDNIRRLVAGTETRIGEGP